MTWIGAVAPAGVPANIVARLNRELVEIMRAPELREKLLRFYLAYVVRPAADSELHARQRAWLDAQSARVIKAGAPVAVTNSNASVVR